MALALLSSAVAEDHEARDERADVRHGDVEAGVPQRLGHEADLQWRTAPSAPVEVVRQGEPAQVGHAAPEIAWEVVALVPLLGERRRAVLGHERLGGLLQQRLFIAESEVHRVPPKFRLDSVSYLSLLYLMAMINPLEDR